VDIFGNSDFQPAVNRLLDAAKALPEDARDGRVDSSLAPLIMATLSLALVCAQAYVSTTRNPFDDWIVGALRTFLPGLERAVREVFD
jgi:hypothetical protein